MTIQDLEQDLNSYRQLRDKAIAEVNAILGVILYLEKKLGELKSEAP